MFYIKRNNNELNLFNEMTNLFTNAFTTRCSLLKTDIVENDKEFVFTIDVPGIKKDAIKINVEDEYLNISVEQKEESESNDNNYVKKERKIESCSRSFYIGNVNKENVKAKINDGILTINIPKENIIEDNKTYINIE